MTLRWTQLFFFAVVDLFTDFSVCLCFLTVALYDYENRGCSQSHFTTWHYIVHLQWSSFQLPFPFDTHFPDNKCIGF